MRTTRDRLRQSVLFELVALLLVTPVGGLLYGVDTLDFGVVALACTTIAMAWTYVYNLGFDHAMLRWRGRVDKRLRDRLLHALLLEAGLVALLVPVIALYLGVTWWQAFVMDLSLTVFYAAYALVFTWGYDRVFPVPARGDPA